MDGPTWRKLANLEEGDEMTTSNEDADRDQVRTDVRSCARCGSDHDGLLFDRMTNPVGVLSHGALCPTLGEPILLRQVGVDVDAGADDRSAWFAYLVERTTSPPTYLSLDRDGIARWTDDPLDAIHVVRRQDADTLAGDCPDDVVIRRHEFVGPSSVAPSAADVSFDDLRSANVARCERGFGHAVDDWNTLEWLGALCGEAGEAANLAKKIRRVDAGMTVGVMPADASRPGLVRRLARELADVVVYADLAAAREGVDLGAAVREAFNAKSDAIGSDVVIGGAS